MFAYSAQLYLTVERQGMAESKRTQGEQLFEQYLASMGLPFKYEESYAGKLKAIDYRIEWNGNPHFLEVKDFKSPPLPTRGFCQVQVHDPIRERILRCRKKFKEYRAFCCAAVFFNTGALAMLESADAMLGRCTVIPVLDFRLALRLGLT